MLDSSTAKKLGQIFKFSANSTLNRSQSFLQFGPLGANFCRQSPQALALVQEAGVDSRTH